MEQELQIYRTVSEQDMTVVSETARWKEPVYLKSQCGELECFTDIACTLMARDYKGSGNQRGNGVIELHEE